MSCFFKSSKETTVTITNHVEINNVVYYEIYVKVDQVTWFVQKRYKEFDELNSKLVQENGISKKLLPPKKIVGNKIIEFIELRQKQLEEYLQNLLNFFRIAMPRTFLEFLDFNKYDIIYLLQDLSKNICEMNVSLLSTIKSYTFSALEVFAISERLCLPCPTLDEKDNYDFSHVLDFCNNLENVKIKPIQSLNGDCNKDFNTVDVPINKSNIIPNNLRFNLNAFHNLKNLQIYGISPDNITDISQHRLTLKSFEVHNTTITGLNQILLCDNLHKNSDVLLKTDEWKSLEELNASCNLLTPTIDHSISLASQLKSLNLKQNRLKSIQHLTGLWELQYLNLSKNLFTECLDWHLQLGNLVKLNLSNNKIKQLSGLRKLLSLVDLNLSYNVIEDLEEINYISGLPLLEHLQLTGNPLVESVDYRPRVLARFHKRLADVFLDNEKASASELDTAQVISAIRQSNRMSS